MNAPTAFPDPAKPVPPYKHTPLFPLGKDETPYKKITAEGVRVEKVLGKDMLVVSREALRDLSERQHRRRRRAADVPGHRHRDHHGQEGLQRHHRR
jgi:hypothetical protein